MPTPLFTWPKIIGLVVFSLGFGASLLSISLTRIFVGFGGASVDREGLAWVVCFILITALSYPLYRGREWARRTCLGIAVLCSVSAVAVAAFRFPRSMVVSGGPSPLTKWLVMDGVISGIGFTLLLVSLPGFFVLLLCHPDVVAAFRHHGTPYKVRAI